MNTRIATLAAAAALSISVASSAIALEPPKITAKDVPTPKDRCFLTCDAMHRQCTSENNPAAQCTGAHESCRKSCEPAEEVPLPSQGH